MYRAGLVAHARAHALRRAPAPPSPPAFSSPSGDSTAGSDSTSTWRGGGRLARPERRSLSWARVRTEGACVSAPIVGPAASRAHEPWAGQWRKCWLRALAITSYYARPPASLAPLAPCWPAQRAREPWAGGRRRLRAARPHSRAPTQRAPASSPPCWPSPRVQQPRAGAGASGGGGNAISCRALAGTTYAEGACACSPLGVSAGGAGGSRAAAAAAAGVGSSESASMRRGGCWTWWSSWSSSWSWSWCARALRSASFRNCFTSSYVVKLAPDIGIIFSDAGT
mmetsp:Transcript_38389/g.83506  ORF Transcript_38389/g.83506 Transcript_38389/m.83506 type:complete len:282 (+) Transcript_38389:589-1434(+)